METILEEDKEFWKELITCFPLILRGPHRKQRVKFLRLCFLCSPPQNYINRTTSGFQKLFEDIQRDKQQGDLISRILFFQYRKKGARNL
jgi:hypothetical protein